MLVEEQPGTQMDLRQLLEAIGTTYSPQLGMRSPAQALLKSAKTLMLRWVAPGYKALGSGGKGQPAFVPWIAVLDPDETSTPERGMYVVYLFAVESGSVVLSLNQGVTEHVETLGLAKGRAHLADLAVRVRALLPQSAILGLDEQIALPRTAARPVSYSYGNIVAKTYRLHELPSNRQMADDLTLFMRLFEIAREIRDRQAKDSAGSLPQLQAGRTFLPEFKPKSDSEYIQNIVGQLLMKGRRHEKLVRLYGEHLAACGHQVATNVHPRDMIALKGGGTTLIEVKVVYRGDGMHAARDALGQLLAYRFLHHRNSQVGLTAVFSEFPGDLAVAMLEANGISTVWWHEDTWWPADQSHDRAIT